jgi:hypothetical protein
MAAERARRPLLRQNGKPRRTAASALSRRPRKRSVKVRNASMNPTGSTKVTMSCGPSTLRRVLTCTTRLFSSTTSPGQAASSSAFLPRPPGRVARSAPAVHRKRAPGRTGCTRWLSRRGLALSSRPPHRNGPGLLIGTRPAEALGRSSGMQLGNSRTAQSSGD